MVQVSYSLEGRFTIAFPTKRELVVRTERHLDLYRYVIYCPSVDTVVAVSEYAYRTRIIAWNAGRHYANTYLSQFTIGKGC